MAELKIKEDVFPSALKTLWEQLEKCVKPGKAVEAKAILAKAFRCQFALDTDGRDDITADYMPTPEEIAAKAKEISDSWTDAEREARLKKYPDSAVGIKNGVFVIRNRATKGPRHR